MSQQKPMQSQRAPSPITHVDIKSCAIDYTASAQGNNAPVFVQNPAPNASQPSMPSSVVCVDVWS